MKQILIFILFSAILCWFMFAPVYKHVLIARHALLQKEADYLLEIGANGAHGYIDAAAIDASRNRLAAAGFDSAKLRYIVTTTNGQDGTNPDSPVLRGAGIGLEIRYPFEDLLAIDRLIGITPPDPNEQMVVSGMKMSEYVP
ncbi:MAG TPA: hypothetical protein VF260_07350 [Bacilli bacterium]